MGSRLFSWMIILWVASTFLNDVRAITSNVLEFGASPDGEIDSTNSFEAAWDAACMAGEPSTMYTPRGTYLVNSIEFSGPCTSPSIDFIMEGTLTAPQENIRDASWIRFLRVKDISIIGGILDGRGTQLWKCKDSQGSCPPGPRSLTIAHSRRVTVRNLNSINPKLFHMSIYHSKWVSVHGSKLVAPGESPNTDGIHVEMSSSVSIFDTTIGTGDDCISVGPGTSNLTAENIICGPGHGISIGSLGWKRKEYGVENVRIRNVTLERTQNGLRIKTWARPSTGYVKDVVFEHATMKDVWNPILIDQNYCPGIKGCPNQVSGVKIVRVRYKHIRGTSSTKVAVKLDCSSSNPCRRIDFRGIDITYKGKKAQSSCEHVNGNAFRMTSPPSCVGS